MATRALPRHPHLPPLSFETLLRLLRAGVAGALATFVDVGVLTALVAGLRMSPRIASVPALIAGGIANFVGNRHFAFRASSDPVMKQALLYTVVEVIALALNGALFDLVLRTHPEARHAYPLVRLATSHLVFLCWSYPLWNRVFSPAGTTGQAPLDPKGTSIGTRAR